MVAAVLVFVCPTNEEKRLHTGPGFHSSQYHHGFLFPPTHWKWRQPSKQCQGLIFDQEDCVCDIMWLYPLDRSKVLNTLYRDTESNNYLNESKAIYLKSPKVNNHDASRCTDKTKQNKLDVTLPRDVASKPNLQAHATAFVAMDCFACSPEAGAKEQTNSRHFNGLEAHPTNKNVFFISNTSMGGFHH